MRGGSPPAKIDPFIKVRGKNKCGNFAGNIICGGGWQFADFSRTYFPFRGISHLCFCPFFLVYQPAKDSYMHDYFALHLFCQNHLLSLGYAIVYVHLLAMPPKHAFMWSYYVYEAGKGTIRCIVNIAKPDGSEAECGRTYQWKTGDPTTSPTHHLVSEHGLAAKQEKRARENVLELMHKHARTRNSMAYENLSKMEQCVVLWGEQNLPFTLIDNPRFRHLFAKSLPDHAHRHELSTATNAFAATVDTQVASILKNKVGTLAFDAWKNLGDSNVNTAIIVDDTAYYVSSDIILQKDGATYAALCKSKVKLILEKYQFHAIAVVGDNESALQAGLHTLLQKDANDPDFVPVVTVVRCAMHSLALVMKDFNAHNPIKSASAVLDSVVDAFGSPTLRQKLHDVQVAAGMPPVRLLRPVETRIAVLHPCLVRLFKLKPYLDSCLADVLTVTPQQWEAVDKSQAALLPFARAIAVVERDGSSLWDVYKEFSVLEKLVDTWCGVDGYKTYAQVHLHNTPCGS